MLDAVIELFEQGDLTPGVHEVADRSGVSLRSVYRYFADVDDLILAAIDRQLEACAPMFGEPEHAGSTSERIRSFCADRVALFGSCRTAYRAALIRSSDQPAVRERVQRCRSSLADQVQRTFEAELAAMPPGEAEIVSATLDTLTQFDALEYLVSARDLDADDATRFLVAAVGRVLCCRP